MHERRERFQIDARTPAGTRYELLVIPRGDTFHQLWVGRAGGSNSVLVDIAAGVSAELTRAAIPQLRRGWKVGIIRVQGRPFLGPKLVHSERFRERLDALERLADLKSQVEQGTIPSNWQ